MHTDRARAAHQAAHFRKDIVSRNNLVVSIWRSQYDVSDAQRRIDEEEAAIRAADTSHLDNKRVEIYIDSIRAETEKAYHCRVGYWRSGHTYMAWIPKSKIEFTRDDRRQALIPVWLAKRIGERITIRTRVVD
ncbi:MAG: hypothetical protein V7641_2457 [Blastocatellia bacterium]